MEDFVNFERLLTDEQRVLQGTMRAFVQREVTLSCLNEARFGIAWGAIGAALAVAEHALAYARERVQFGGKPIAAHQLVQDKLVFMVSEIAKAQQLTGHSAFEPSA